MLFEAVGEGLGYHLLLNVDRNLLKLMLHWMYGEDIGCKIDMLYVMDKHKIS